MYKLRFQKCGPYAWGEVHVVVGELEAVASVYNTLLATARKAGHAWERRLVAEVTAVNGDGEFDKVYQWGTFKPRGTPSADEDLGEE